MSGESAHHIRLVETLIETIRERHFSARGIIVLADHRSYGADRPPLVGGFTPDVYASDVPATFRVLGEAKTPDDLETDRSRRQIAAFLDHLCLYRNGTLYLAVPWPFAGRASLMLTSLRRPEHEPVVVRIISCA